MNSVHGIKMEPGTSMDPDTPMEPDRVLGADATSSNNSQEVPTEDEDDEELTVESYINSLDDFHRRIIKKDKLEALIERKALRRRGIFEKHTSVCSELDIVKRNFKWFNYFIKQNFYDDFQDTLEELNLKMSTEVITVEDDFPAENKNNFNASSENIILIEDDDEDSPPSVQDVKPDIAKLNCLPGTSGLVSTINKSIKMENVKVKREKPSSSENFSVPGPSGRVRPHNSYRQRINVVHGANEFIYARFENIIMGEDLVNIPEPSVLSGRGDILKMLHTILTTGSFRLKKNKKRNIAEVNPTPGPSGSENKRIRSVPSQSRTDVSPNLIGENNPESTAVYKDNIGYWIPKIILGELEQNESGPSIEFHTDIDPVCNKDKQYVGYKMFAFVGDENGHIGFSAIYSDNTSAPLHYNKQQALLSMIRIKRYKYEHESQTLYTIAYQVYGKSGDIKVIIMPGFPNSGVRTYHIDVAEAMRLAGIDDCNIIVEGYTGAFDDVENIVKATFIALKQLTDSIPTAANF